MTTRRSPVIVGCGSASRLKSVNLSGSLSPKGSFFTRQYSTSSFLRTSHVRNLVGDRISVLRRHTVDSSRPLTDAAAVSQRYALKARAFARGRSNYVVGNRETGAGTLDIRFSRLKSPRNRQFLQRLSGASNVFSTFKRKLFKDRLYSRFLTAANKASSSESFYRAPRSTRSLSSF